MDVFIPAALHRAALRLAYLGLRVYWRVFQPRTQGACVIVLCDGRVLLVRHSYKRGLGVPAGGLARHEAPLDAALRELREEVGIEATADELEPAGHSVGREHGNEDHLDYFVLHRDTAPGIRVDGREIVWAGFEALPEALELDLLPGVRRWLERHIEASR